MTLKVVTSVAAIKPVEWSVQHVYAIFLGKSGACTSHLQKVTRFVDQSQAGREEYGKYAWIAFELFHESYNAFWYLEILFLIMKMNQN